ncbi:MAG TPA: hypothetical protein PKW36_01810 [bacterium]|nr:hypothetical protein [bacterium]
MNLLHNKEYFKRYGEHLERTGSPKKAWAATELELENETGGFRRFISYKSFTVKLCAYRHGEINKNISLRYVGEVATK